MKELRIWVPGTKRPGFARELKRQITLIEETSDDRDALAFIEHAADWSD